MTYEDYLEWLSEARSFVAEWHQPHLKPRLDEPLVRHWQSANGAENLLAMMWSGNSYQESWARQIHDRVGEIIGASSDAWKYQLPFYSNVYGNFFRPPNGQFVLNVIIVTPSRVPMRLWPAGRPRVSESPLCPPGQPLPAFQQRSITLSGLAAGLQIDLNSAVWADRALRRDANLKVATTRIRRCFHPWHATVRRLFLADFDNVEDILAITRGEPPACRFRQVTGELLGRVGMPKIQLHRVNEQGNMDVLQLQTSHASGLLVDMRWSHQPFESLMLSEPQQGFSLRETTKFKQKLIPS
jgi:hypothetical protein